jgi:hypothetical protein
VDRLERKLEENGGQLMRSCVELAKAWRTDKYLRRLEAVMLVADPTVRRTSWPCNCIGYEYVDKVVTRAAYVSHVWMYLCVPVGLCMHLYVYQVVA